ncbi:MAG: chorismate synthase, partial [Eubacteriales bacterium]
READRPNIVSGLADGVTCGAPLAAFIDNTNQRSSDYAELAAKPRPSHSDYPASVKYGGHNDISGGGQFSGRLTAPLCFAGAVCMQLLARRGVRIGAHAAAIGGVCDDAFDTLSLSPDLFDSLARSEYPVISSASCDEMLRRIEAARLACDSVGGIIECAVVGMPVGVGEHMFDGVENRISLAEFGVPGVKGIEFGAGFRCAQMNGSAFNDAYYMDGDKVRTRTNNSGGISGGMTNGMPVIFRCAVRPTPSIAREQDTVDLTSRTDAKLSVRGRHDPCIVLRAVPAVEAAAAVAILDMML